MDKADWIVLRMVGVAAKSDKLTMSQHSEVQRAITYLYRKYGGKTLNKCIDQLNGEYAK
jgi:hypothetical protein